MDASRPKLDGEEDEVALEFWSRVLELHTGHKIEPVPFSANGLDWRLLRGETR